MKGLIWMAVLLAAGCTGASFPADPGPLRGEFLIVEVNGEKVAAPMAPTVAFADDGGVTGDAGCNRFGGAFQQDAGAIVIGPLMSSRRACEPAIMDLERTILANLQSSRSLAVSDDGVVMLSGDGSQSLRLQPVAR